MFGLTKTHAAVVVAFLSALGAQVALLRDWHEAVNPVFVGTVVVQFAALLGAIFSDKPEGGGGSGVLRSLVLAFAVGSVAVGATACRTLVPPVTNPQTQSEAGQVAAVARTVVNQAAVALDDVAALGRAGVLTADQVRAIAGEGERLGREAQNLAGYLREYRAVRTAQNYETVRASIKSVKSILDAIVGHVPNPETQAKIRAVLTPVFDAAFSLSTLLDPPLVAATAG